VASDGSLIEFSPSGGFYKILTTFAYFLETPLLKLEVYREDCTDTTTNDDKAVSREMV
jgi:hypothetical protein